MSTIKLGRNYGLLIEFDPKTFKPPLFITLPFTIEFDITRNALTSANTCQIRIYNLSEKNRNSILFNAFNVGTFNTITLFAGYTQGQSSFLVAEILLGTAGLTTIFYGNITEAWSVREGTNFITQIECYDGGFAFTSGDVNLGPFPAGTPLQFIIETLMVAVPNTTFGACGIFEGVIDKKESYQGNVVQILNRITGGAFFIDKGKTYVLKTNDYVLKPGLITQVKPSTGLLNTPVLEQSMMRFEMLFEPSIDVGSLVEVFSTTYPTLTGVYIARSVKHRGIISPVTSGSLTTTADFLYTTTPVPVAGT